MANIWRVMFSLNIFILIRAVELNEQKYSSFLFQYPAMLNLSQSYFLSSFKSSHYFLRAFGLWPFSIVCDESNGGVQKPKVTKIDLLWFIVSIHLYILAAIVFFNNRENFERKNVGSTAKYIIINGEFVRLAFCLTLIALLIGIDMCNRFKLVSVVNMFVAFDKLVDVLVSTFIFVIKYLSLWLYSSN